MGRKPKETINDFGLHLRKCRDDLGYTQEDLAMLIGVRSSVISKYELGESYPRRGNLDKLNRVLETNLEVYIPEERLKNMNITIINEELRNSYIDQKNEIPEVKNYTSKILSKQDIYDLLIEVDHSWFNNVISPSIKLLYSDFLVIDEFNSELIVNENYVYIRGSTTMNCHYFINAIGNPSAVNSTILNNNITHNTIWLNYRLSEFDQYAILQENFKEGSLHYFNSTLNWLAMKTYHQLNI